MKHCKLKQKKCYVKKNLAKRCFNNKVSYELIEVKILGLIDLARLFLIIVYVGI